MLISTGLLSEIEKSIASVEKWNLIPFNCPLNIIRGKHKNKQGNHTFQVVPNKAFCIRQWKIHFGLLFLTVWLCLYRYQFESKSMLSQTAEKYKIFLFSYYSLTFYFLHKYSPEIATFWNDLLTFESAIQFSVNGKITKKLETNF